MFLNCGVKTLESSLDCKEIQPFHPKGNQSCVFIGRTDAEAETPNTLATSCEELTHWKRPWCWEGLGAGGEGNNRGWDGWMASLTRWTRVWVNSGSLWWTGRPDVLQFMGSQRVGHDWATELNWRRRALTFCTWLITPMLRTLWDYSDSPFLPDSLITSLTDPWLDNRGSRTPVGLWLTRKAHYWAPHSDITGGFEWSPGVIIHVAWWP